MIHNFDRFINENKNPITPGVIDDKVESWVNIKIDKDLPVRISRYTKAIDKYAVGNGTQISKLKKKLQILSSPTKNNSKYGAQCMLSIMILLQYLKEIRSNFDASSAGHLFEDYIAGLLHGSKIGDNKANDYIDNSGKTYQIKFLENKRKPIEVRSKLYDYYIIGIKEEKEAHIWIIEDKGLFKIEDYVMPHYTIDQETGDFYRDENEEEEVLLRKIDLTRLLKEKESGAKIPYTLNFNNIDKIINEIADGLRGFIEDMYNNISELHYNVETIITGVDKNGKPIRKMDEYYTKASDNMEEIKNDLLTVKDKITLNLKRKKISN